MVCFALQAIAVDSVTSKRVSVEQLEHLLSAAKTKGDVEIAKQLSGLVLTERLGTARFVQLNAELPGERSQQALLALADVSSFLPPASSEIPATAAPDQATQRQIMALTVKYLAKTIPLLPNLFATRDTTRFESRPSPFHIDPDPGNPLRAVNRSILTIYFRNGQESLDAGAKKDSRRATRDKGLTTWGEFGPILAVVLMDAAQNQLAWSHWELGNGGLRAVFRYSVPKEKSHYDLRFCCVTESYGFEVNYLSQRVGYRGEITVDPDSGAILRLMVVGDVDPGNPVTQASLLVEYGPEEIGGRTYICPVHGIALAHAPDLKVLSKALTQLRDATPESHTSLERTNLSSLTREAQQTLLNDVRFRDYHLFRSELHILTGKESQNASPSADSVISPPGAFSPENARPTEEATGEASPAIAQPTPEAAAASSATSLPLPPIPEIYVTALNGLPEMPEVLPRGTSGATFTYRINARLVDVSLVAFDKKGRPLTNLRPEDVEIYDNGLKVELRAFSRAQRPIPERPTSTAQPPGLAGQPEFSNRSLPSTLASANIQNTIVLLIDSTLSFGDLSNAREQMVRFVDSLSENEQVAIYVVRRDGFQVLQDTITDDRLVGKTLSKWTPSADNVSLGEQQEARNRQQMEYVHNTEDLLSVNGRGLMDNQLQTQAIDPQLRELGDNPGGGALSGFVMLARHLASVPGHKSLVWIASDNVLADWTWASIQTDKGSRHIEPMALRAQEAMNEAHVSLYPLNASQLEAGGLNASVGERNVQLNPAATANQLPKDQLPGGAATANQSKGGCGPVIAGSMAAQVSGNGPELTSGEVINPCGKDLDPGRITAQMKQDLHPIQGVYREIADATGGRTFRRASNIVAELNDVVADGRATYLLSFAPPQAPDAKFHVITIKLTDHKDVSLHYRSGYFYRQELTSLRDRFREAVLQPEEETEIGLQANLMSNTKDRIVKLGIAATDLEIAQKDAFWTDKLDIYVVQREVAGMKAHVSGQTMNLRLHPDTYQKYLQGGIPFDQVLEVASGVGSIRIIVLDENSGRMGSLTIPVASSRNRPE
jgi:VWFA-related protein